MDADPVVVVTAAQLTAPVPGGTGRYARQLVGALGASRPPDLQLRAAVAPGPAPEPPLEVPTVTLPGPPRLLSRLWERDLPPDIRTGDLVHATTLLVPPRRRDQRLVVTVHDVVPWTHPETLTSRGVRFHRRMGDRTARQAHLVVTPTEAVAGQVRRWLAPSAPVVAVPLGVTPAAAPPDADARRRRLGVTNPYVLFVGTAEPRKGLDVLVAAMTRPSVSGLGLVVVGPPGWGDTDVAELAGAAGLGERVVVTGLLSEQDLAACYAGAEVVAVPSRAEGFGLPVVEALAHGLPVVTSDDPALVEVGGGVTEVVPVGDPDALADACAAVVRSGATGAAARREHAAAFTWERTAGAMWSWYREVLGPA